MRSIACYLAFSALPLSAQELTYPLICSGSDPTWTLEVAGETATLDFQRSSEMDVMLVTPAEGRDWPVALTLIGRGDSAILIVDQGLCNGYDHGARVLTQRGETPLLLVGCCLRN
ncbi:hypothetical protein L0666_02925 [Octadecabacter sp. CECT 8868]|uniref:hypothetical protein n=1 Tax=Octadecabacter algicola TaxID=2909342 RepID=UPI001F387D0F|nr:hypothetical protein [Octadecabacter algicola]MCF2903928.1 hypothetical protein [Octadecabacter algicola]